MDMTAEEKSDIIKRIVDKVHAAGLKTRGKYITIEELVVSPDFAKAVFGEEPVKDNVPAWRRHQHQLLDFIQGYNTDEMLRYVDAYIKYEQHS